MRPEGYPFFCDLTQLIQTENLESAGVSENRSRPAHESVQSAKPAHLLHARPEQKMVGISEQNLDIQILKKILRHALHRRQRSHRHEHRGFNRAMRGNQSAPACAIQVVEDLKLKRHRKILKHWLEAGGTRQPLYLVKPRVQ